MKNNKNKRYLSTKYPLTTSMSISMSDFNEKAFKEDCPGYEQKPLIIPAAKRVIAIGDIHGDYDLAVESFKLAGLIDDNLNWIGKDTIVVQVGDQIDNCRPTPFNDCQNKKLPDDEGSDIKVLNFFNEMDKKAASEGGMVISLLGNHEIMNVQGNFNYVSYENLTNFSHGELKGSDGRLEAFQQGGPVAKMLACSRYSSVIVGSHLFVHAGILPALITRLSKMNNIGTLTKSMEINKAMTQYIYLNEVIRKWLLDKLPQNVNSMDMKAILNSNRTSPFWPRIYGNIKPNEPDSNKMCRRYLKPILETLQVGHLIIGHTPQGFEGEDGINSTCDGKIFRVDGGFAKAFKIFDKGRENKIQVLEILNDTKYNILTKKIR